MRDKGALIASVSLFLRMGRGQMNSNRCCAIKAFWAHGTLELPFAVRIVPCIMVTFQVGRRGGSKRARGKTTLIWPSNYWIRMMGFAMQFKTGQIDCAVAAARRCTLKQCGQIPMYGPCVSSEAGDFMGFELAVPTFESFFSHVAWNVLLEAFIRVKPG